MVWAKCSITVFHLRQFGHIPSWPASQSFFKPKQSKPIFVKSQFFPFFLSFLISFFFSRSEFLFRNIVECNSSSTLCVVHVCFLISCSANHKRSSLAQSLRRVTWCLRTNDVIRQVGHTAQLQILKRKSVYNSPSFQCGLIVMAMKDFNYYNVNCGVSRACAPQGSPWVCPPPLSPNII